MDQKAAEVPEQPVPPEFPKTRGLMLEGRLGGAEKTGRRRCWISEPYRRQHCDCARREDKDDSPSRSESDLHPGCPVGSPPPRHYQSDTAHPGDISVVLFRRGTAALSSSIGCEAPGERTRDTSKWQ